MEIVEPNKVSETYKKIDGASPNALYKRYVAWHQEKYQNTKAPLSFKNWINWAKNKSLINQNTQNADGEQTIGEEVLVEVKNKRNKIVLVLAGIAIAGLIIGLVKNQNQSE